MFDTLHHSLEIVKQLCPQSQDGAFVDYTIAAYNTQQCPKTTTLFSTSTAQSMLDMKSDGALLHTNATII